jgi:hypothetical protein
MVDRFRGFGMVVCEASISMDRSLLERRLLVSLPSIVGNNNDL